MRSSAFPWGLTALTFGGAAGWWLLTRRPAIDYRGQVVLITGGSRGLGLELARQWGAAGARVALAARTQADLQRAVDELKACGYETLSIAMDVADPPAAAAAIAQVVEAWGAIDVLINNAGIIQVGPLPTMTDADFEQALQTHFWGPYRLIQAALPHFRKQGSGQIINIASIGGEISVPHMLPYCASKFALVGLSTGVRAELAPEGMDVTTVCPGLMRTGSPRNAQFKGKHRAEYAWFSISDSLPLVSQCSQTAARRIFRAAQRRQAHVRLAWPAHLAALAQGLVPNVAAQGMMLMQRLLPAATETTRSWRGDESFSRWSPSLLTKLTEQAVQRNNELR